MECLVSDPVSCTDIYDTKLISSESLRTKPETVPGFRYRHVSQRTTLKLVGLRDAQLPYNTLPLDSCRHKMSRSDSMKDSEIYLHHQRILLNREKSFTSQKESVIAIIHLAQDTGEHESILISLANGPPRASSRGGIINGLSIFNPQQPRRRMLLNDFRTDVNIQDLPPPLSSLIRSQRIQPFDIKTRYDYT